MARRNRRNLKNKKHKIIQKNLVRNIFIVVILIVFLFVIYKFNFSSKSEIMETTRISFKEYGTDSVLSLQEMDVEVKTDESGNKYILLPETINGYFVQNYHIIENNVEDDNTLPSENTNSILENVVLDNTVQDDVNIIDTNNTNNVVNENTIPSEEKITENIVSDDKVVEEIAGLKKIYLTSQNYENEVNSNDENKVIENTTNTSVIENTISENKINSSSNTIKEENVNKVENVTNTVKNDNNTIENNVVTEETNTIENENVISDEVNETEDAINEIVTTAEKDNFKDTSYNVGAQYYLEINKDGEAVLGDVTIEVEYQVITLGDQRLYKQKLIEKSPSNLAEIQVIGYAPIDYKLVITEADKNDINAKKSNVVENGKKDEALAESTILCAYDFNIQKDGEIFDTVKYGQSYIVKITSSELENKISGNNISIIHLALENGLDVIYDIPIKSKETNFVEFETDSFSPYAVLAYPAITGETITIDDYLSDYNYYKGRDYTDEMKGELQNKYTDDKLAKIKINYYSYNYNDVTPVSCNLTGTLRVNSSIRDNVTRYYNYNVTINTTGDKYIDKEQNWTMSFTIPNTVTLNIDSTKQANTNLNFDSMEYVNNVLTIKGKNWKTGWNNNSNVNNEYTSFTEDSINLTLVLENNVANNVLQGINTIKVVASEKSKVGYVSSTERQNLFTYIKCVPKDANGNISLELIDNPYMDRPVGYGFDGWTTTEKYNINLQPETKVQTLTTNIGDSKEATINVYANWKSANVIYLNFGNGSDRNNGKTINTPVNSWSGVSNLLTNNRVNATNASDRELNIVVLIGGTLNTGIINNGILNTTVPCTITSLDNGKDYRNVASLNFGNNFYIQNDLQLDYLNITGSNNYIDTTTTDTISRYIIGNARNLRIGRGMMPLNATATNDQTTFAQVQGGSNTTTNPSRAYKLVVETGKYANMHLVHTSSRTCTIDATMVLGNDYDRVKNENSQLRVYNRLASRAGSGTITSKSSGNVYDMRVKSGTFGLDFFNSVASTNEDRAFSGIYVGGHSSGTDNNDRILTVEGGEIANILGGLAIQSDTSKVKTYIYVKGGKTKNIVGGAGVSTTRGDRIIQVTDGEVEYSVSGGSNGESAGRSGSSNPTGQLNGNTLVYIGGNAVIGSTTDTNTLYGVEPGCVLGAGNGNAAYSNTAGMVTSTHIIVDGNAKIKNSVYGGGNYGIVNFDNNSSIIPTEPAVEFINSSRNFIPNEKYMITTGKESGDDLIVNRNNLSDKAFDNTSIPTEQEQWIFEPVGNGNYYLKNISTNLYINLEYTYNYNNRGRVTGINSCTDRMNNAPTTEFSISNQGTDGIGIYNSITYDRWTGSNNNGRYESTTERYYLNITSNSFTTNARTVYLLQYKILEKEDTDVDDITDPAGVTIDILNGNIDKNVYGGSNRNDIRGNVKINMKNGNVLGTIYGGSNIEGDITKSTRIKIDGGFIGSGNDSIFAGGCGNQTTVRELAILNIIDNNTDININGNIYGGSEEGTVNGNSVVNVKDIFNNSKINIVGNIFGAGKGSSNYLANNNSNVKLTIDGGSYKNVCAFGGNNIEGIVRGNVTVRIGENQKTFIEEVYGGGKDALLQNDNGNSSDEVYLYKNATVTNAFNGGNKAGISDNIPRAIYAKGANITNLYGGSNIEGDLNITNVYCSDSAKIKNVYGGGLGENAHVTENTNVSIIDSTITNTAFGGGNAGSVQNNTSIISENSTIQNLYGGGLGLTATVGANGGKTTINLKDTTVNENTYGGGCLGTVEKDAEEISTDIIFDNSTTKDLYGGGQGIEATVAGNTRIALTNGSIINENVYGGGDQAEVKQNTEINVNLSKIEGNLYGGGNGAESQPENITNVPGKVGGITKTTIENTSIINGNAFAGGKGITAVVDNDTNMIITTNSIVQMNVYGGGDNGSVSGSTNVEVNSSTIGSLAEEKNGNVFGAGKGLNAIVAGNTQLNIINVLDKNKIIGDVYGGGELGDVKGSTFVRITSSNIAGSAYGAGKGELGPYNKNLDQYEHNGMYALVEGSSTIIAEGKTTIEHNLFGGGDASNIGARGTGKDDIAYMENSNAHVYISGALINGNVYGGANRSKVWGNSEIYIGKKSLDLGYEQGKIEILGTVFGGGESVNDEGTFSYDFKSVNGDIVIDVNGENYDTTEDNSINIFGSIFGSGNASSAAKNGDITITNYGETEKPKNGVSIQRATNVVLDKSSIRLSGATDSTNEYADTNYTLNNVYTLKVKNGSTMYLRYGSNLLASFYSLVDNNGVEEPAKVTITDDYQITDKNVDNRLYMYSGQNLNVANSEDVLGEYGIVQGMTFFGIYEEDSNGNIYSGIYDPDYVIGNAPTWTERNFSRSYVLGLHQANHDIKVNGFYTVYEELTEEAEKLQKENNLTQDNYSSSGSFINYITPTPPSDDYYMWYTGPNRPTYNYSFVLLASKYSTLGAKELNLVGLSFPNATLTLNNFGISNWKDGVGLYDKNSIKNIETDQEKANNNLALTMKTGNSGWSSNASTDLFIDPNKKYEAANDYIKDEDYKGDNKYLFENASSTPTLSFYLYHSNNIQITDRDNLGSYKLAMDLSYVDGQNRGTGEVIIDIAIKVLDASDEGYNASITPGSKYELFTATTTDITSKSSLSAFFELAQANFKNGEGNENNKNLYDNSYRVINTEYSLPENTTITMIDRSVNGNPRYYYYTVKPRYDNDGNLIQSTEYRLSDFMAMGSTNEPYNEKEMNSIYYNTDIDYQYESFIFIINFENAEFSDAEKAKIKITEDPKITIELRSYDNNSDKDLTLSSLIDYQLNNGSTKYNVYNGEAEIGVKANLSNPKLYVGFTDKLNVNTTYTTTTIKDQENLVKVYDTQYFDKKLGVKLTLKKFEGYDTSGNIIAGETIQGSQLLGTYFEVNGNKYYPRTDGTTRIKIAELVSNVASTITINAEKSSLVSGEYVVVVETFGSADGIYFGVVTSAQTMLHLTVVNDKYGMKSTIPENQVIVDKSTGYTLDNNGYISKGDNNLNVVVEYASSLSNPYVTVSLERRKYGDKDDYANEEVYNREYSAKGIDLANYVEKISDDGQEIPLTSADVIKVLDKNEANMTSDELLRKDRVEYEAITTIDLKTESPAADIIGKFNLNYKYLSPENGLTSGTYRLVYTLYDINNGEYQYIGEVFSYIIIK